MPDRSDDGRATRRGAGPERAPARRGSVARAARLACALALAGVAAAAPPPQDEPQFQARPFQIYDSLAARAVADSARDHIAARRWSEALVDLQRLLEEHRGEVLGGSRPTAEGARNRSQGDVHVGASQWARTQLFALPEEARKLYRERHAAHASESLERALGAGDRAALASVGRRWPSTEAALRAWWALGDLEIERGELEDGLRAWARAAGLSLGEPDRSVAGPDGWRALRDALAAADAPEGALARVRFALGTMSSATAGAPRDAARAGSEPWRIGEQAAGFLQGIATTSLVDPAGFGNEGWASAWRVPRRGGVNPFADEDGLMRVFGARDASTVFVNTSRAVFGIGAFSGQTVWSFGPSELGWDRVTVDPSNVRASRGETTLDEFQEAIDPYNQIVAPAVAHGVVVAALQLPLAYEKRDQFNRIEIIDVIPERRLVGLDAATGAELWNHFPPARWDGDSGTFSARMTVVGPPVVVGARVLVPLARQRGRIEMHLGCVDLRTGKELWSAPLVTGQVPLNMFGRQVREFSAPPVAVSGGTVVVQTNLGVMAAVDLFTGETLWETVYGQVPILAPTYYEEGQLHSRWRNAPPAVVGGTAVATPLDSPDLIAVDLATGALRWSVDHDTVINHRAPSSGPASEVFLGADERRAYFFAGGDRVLAMRAVEGIERSPPVRVDWEHVHPERGAWRRSDMALPAIDGRHVFVPGASSLTILDRATGVVVREIPGDLGAGNLLVSPGALISVSAEDVTAAFEWKGMVERAAAAAAAAPNDARPAAELARLYAVRGDAEALAGDDEAALRLFTEARRTLAAAGAELPSAPRLLREPLFHALASEARVRRRNDDKAGAAECLERALAAAPDAERRREALLVLQAVQRTRAAARPEAGAAAPRDGSNWDATLDLLAAEFGRTELTVAFQPAASFAPGGVGGRSLDPWLGELVPLEARLAPAEGGRSGGDEPGERATLELGFWVLIERAAESRRRGDGAGEARSLFDILREHGGAALPGGGGVSTRNWAAGRLGALRDEAGDELFAPYEAEAARQLELARESGRRDALARIPALFPGTDAARRANDLRLDFAVEAGEVEEVARIVLDPLPADATVGALGERDLRLVLRLAAALGARGNSELRAALGERIAEVRPAMIVDLAPYRGTTIRELADRWRSEVPAPVERSAEFGVALRTTERVSGDFAFLTAALDPAGTPLAIFQSELGLIAVRPGDRTGFAWNTRFRAGVDWASRRERSHLVGNRIVVAARAEIACFDAADGAPSWSWSADEGTHVLRTSCSDGVVLARVRPEFSNGTESLVALDATSGVELWRRATPAGTVPVAGEGKLALLLEPGERAEVIDLFLGGRERALAIGPRQRVGGARAWISGGMLVVPQFLRESEPEHNAVLAFDLATGEEAWRIDLEKHRGAPHVLTAVVEHAPEGARPRRLFVLRPKADARGAGRRTVHVLDESLGALDRAALFELRPQAQLLGLESSGVLSLDSPLVFAMTPASSGDRSTLSAFDVHRGSLWEALVPKPVGDASLTHQPVPAVSSTTVALAYVSPVQLRNRSLAEWELTFFDRADGALRESRPLPRDEPQARWREVVALGGALFLSGLDRLDRME